MNGSLSTRAVLTLGGFVFIPKYLSRMSGNLGRLHCPLSHPRNFCQLPILYQHVNELCLNNLRSHPLGKNSVGTKIFSNKLIAFPKYFCKFVML